jgi:hypothetical protein
MQGNLSKLRIVNLHLQCGLAKEQSQVHPAHGHHLYLALSEECSLLPVINDVQRWQLLRPNHQVSCRCSVGTMSSAGIKDPELSFGI